MFLKYSWLYSAFCMRNLQTTPQALRNLILSRFATIVVNLSLKPDSDHFREIRAVMQKPIVLFYIEVNFGRQIVNAFQMWIGDKKCISRRNNPLSLKIINILPLFVLMSIGYNILKDFRQFYTFIWSDTYRMYGKWIISFSFEDIMYIFYYYKISLNVYKNV